MGPCTAEQREHC